MASTVNLVLSTTDTQRKKETISVTNVNSTATNTQIMDLVDMLMAMTTNNLTSVSKVTKEEVFRNG